MATSEQIRTTIRTYPERYSAGDKEGWLDLFTEDATIEDPVGSEVRRGRAGLAEFWDFTHSLAPGVGLEITGPICVAGSEAAFPLQIKVNGPDGPLALDAIDAMTFADDGRIRSMRAYWDVADLAGPPG